MLKLVQLMMSCGTVFSRRNVFSTLAAMMACAMGMSAEESAPKSCAHLRKPIFGAPVKISFPRVDAAPVLDGAGADACWREIRGISLELPNGVGETLKAELKTCAFRGNVYLLLRFPVPATFSKGARWRWDPVRHAYFISEDREPALVLIFTSNGADIADIWVWRFERNDSAGFADDMFMSDFKRLDWRKLRMDTGTPPWFSRYFGEFAGDDIPRFYSGTPAGSAGDVRGRCSMKNGTATVELARKIKTGRSDDLELSAVSTLRVAFITQSACKRVELPVRNRNFNLKDNGK